MSLGTVSEKEMSIYLEKFGPSSKNFSLTWSEKGETLFYFGIEVVHIEFKDGCVHKICTCESTMNQLFQEFGKEKTIDALDSIFGPFGDEINSSSAFGDNCEIQI